MIIALKSNLFDDLGLHNLIIIWMQLVGFRGNNYNIIAKSYKLMAEIKPDALIYFRGDN